jgi:hypothetical protein
MTEPRSTTTRGPRRRVGELPAGRPLSAEDRIAELEARLADLEHGPGMRERGRSAFDRVVPPEATRHFRQAMREQLLGVRAIVDHWTDRLDAADARAGSRSTRDRETIEID